MTGGPRSQHWGSSGLWSILWTRSELAGQTQLGAGRPGRSCLRLGLLCRPVSSAGLGAMSDESGCSEGQSRDEFCPGSRKTWPMAS